MTDMIRIHITHSRASGKRRGWHKHVTGVDTTKRNGYAFDGQFLASGEQDLPLGAIVIEQEPTGSVKNWGKRGIAYEVTPDGLEEFARCDDWTREFLTFRDAVAEALQDTVDPREQALQTIKHLMATHGITAADLA